MGTGKKSSDDEVSKLILLGREREFFWKINVCMNITFLSKSVYIVCAKRLLIYLVIIAMVKECNCYRSYFNRVSVL